VAFGLVWASILLLCIVGINSSRRTYQTYFRPTIGLLTWTSHNAFSIWQVNLAGPDSYLGGPDS
jgi:hypothetical protein